MKRPKTVRKWTENGPKVDRKRSATYISILLVTMTIITINQITQKMAFLLSLAIYHKKRKEKKYAERRKRLEREQRTYAKRLDSANTKHYQG